MKRRGRSRRLLTFSIFVFLILVSGYVLGAAGYVDSPFDEIAFLSNWVNGGERQFEGDFGSKMAANDVSISTSTSDAFVQGIDLTRSDGASSQFSLPPLDQLDDAQTGSALGESVAQLGAAPEDIGYPANWSNFGDVLYDLWFICATIAVFIVVQWLYKFSSKQLRSRLPAAAANRRAI